MKLRTNRALQCGDRVAMLEEREAEGIAVDVADLLPTRLAIDVERDRFRAEQKVGGWSQLRCRVIRCEPLIRPDSLHAFAVFRPSAQGSLEAPHRIENAKFSLLYAAHICYKRAAHAICGVQSHPFTSVTERAASMGKKAAIQGALRTSEAPDTASFIGQKTLSLSELAASLPVPDTPRLMQRIRHWTREGALHPSKFAHAGRGKHREYDPDARYCAMALHYMTLAGLPVAHSQFLEDAMHVVSSKAAKWQTA